ncbi:hypothetical protein B0H10DRAFT_8309 [Mycena sp. CBHHK59/15]|nr:hypothetical protein B0H10DRAFT_8309 [Mycena sp. CBHHK59/15]
MYQTLSRASRIDPVPRVSSLDAADSCLAILLAMTWSKFQLTSLLVVLTVVSTTLNVALLLKVVGLSHGKFAPLGFNYEYSYEPREVPGWFSAAAMALEMPDSSYPLTDDQKWASIVPPQRGFVRLGPDGTPFSIALFHQLHCINGVRFAYIAVRDGLFKTPEARKASFQHVNHCFDVLRQSLLCKADTTLMALGTTNHTRRCRDWSPVREFVDSNHAFWQDVPFKLPPSNQTSSNYRPDTT